MITILVLRAEFRSSIVDDDSPLIRMPTTYIRSIIQIFRDTRGDVYFGTVYFSRTQSTFTTLLWRVEKIIPVGASSKELFWSLSTCLSRTDDKQSPYFHP